MRSRLLLVTLAFAAITCGGSASETPWPAEPEGKLLGPAGESVQRDEGRPNAIADAGPPDVEP
jgi:hypothetical protein